MKFATLAVGFMMRSLAIPKTALPPAQSLRICPKILPAPSVEWERICSARNNSLKQY